MLDGLCLKFPLFCRSDVYIIQGLPFSKAHYVRYIFFSFLCSFLDEIVNIFQVFVDEYFPYIL